MILPSYKDNSSDVYIGDCAHVLPQLSIKANLILTSPPYDKLRRYSGADFRFEDVADVCIETLMPGGVLVWVVDDATINGARTGTSLKQAIYFIDNGLLLHDTMIYHKRGGPASNVRNRHKNAFEYMFVFSKGLPQTVNVIMDRHTAYPGEDRKTTRRDKDDSLKKVSRGYIREITYRDNVWSYSPGYRKSAELDIAHKHPAIFPIGMARDHVLTWTMPGDIVIDPMCGSGTTLRAAKDLNRQGIGVEIYPGYLPIIQQRLSQQTMDLSKAEIVQQKVDCNGNDSDEYEQYSTGNGYIEKLF